MIQPSEEAIREAEGELPAPTAWPMLLGLGIVLAVFGIITNGIFFYCGLAMIFASIFGWMRLLILEAREGHEGHGTTSK